METRQIEITLTQAKNWYYGTNEALKVLALKAFSKKELESNPWERIQFFADACRALGEDVVLHRQNLKKIANMPNGKMLAAQYKLAIIKKALNGDWDPHLNEDTIYYSYLRWYPKGDSYPSDWSKICMLKDTKNGKTYTLVGGDYGCCDYGLGIFGCGCGGSQAVLGLLGCKSREIAKHMGKYFGKIIFEAIYGQYDNYTLIYED